MEVNPIHSLQGMNHDSMPIEQALNNPLVISKPVHPIFPQEDSKKSVMLVDAAAPQPTQASFWELVFSFFWNKPAANKGAALLSPETAVQAPRLELLSSIPAIEKPEGVCFTWTPGMEIKEAKQPLSLQWVKEGLKLASSSTIEEVMFIIFRGQLELEKENAEATEKTFTNQEKAQQLKEKILEEVKEALARDEKVAGYFKTAEILTIAASLFCTAAIAVAFAPSFLAGILPGLAGALSGFITYGTATLTLLDGFKTALEAYYKSKANQNKASFESLRHEKETHRFRMDDMHQHLMAVAERDSSFKEAWLQEMKRIHRMIRLVLQK